MLSTLIIPFIGMALQKRAMAETGNDEPPSADPAPAPATA
jgi:hypothetical protein